jgi:RNA polymerase sigma factor (sigma-70 family)
MPIVWPISYTGVMSPLAGQRSPDRHFERLYRRHVDDVYRYALAVLANRADAEDVAQTTFLNAYRAYQDGRRPERPLNWLITITHNVCRQRFRDAARRPNEVVLDRDIAQEPHGEDSGFRHEDIRRALSQLTFSQRSVLAMRELEGRSYKEIAEVLGITTAAVETLIFRARRAFREQLESSLSCGEAERALSQQLDGMLPRAERAELRAHLRACHECASLARRFRGQQAALRGIALVPLPYSLTSFSVSAAGGSSLAGGAALGAGVGIKVVALGTAALVAAGVSTEILRTSRPARHDDGAVAKSVRPAAAIRVVDRAPVARAPAAVSAPVHAPAAVVKRPARHHAYPAVAVPAPVQVSGAPAAQPPAVAVAPAAQEAPAKSRGNGPQQVDRPSNRPDRPTKPAKTEKHSDSSAPKAQHPAKNDQTDPGSAAGEDHSGTDHGASPSPPGQVDSPPSPGAGGPEGNGPPNDPGSGASKPKDSPGHDK